MKNLLIKTRWDYRLELLSLENDKKNRSELLTKQRQQRILNVLEKINPYISSRHETKKHIVIYVELNLSELAQFLSSYYF